MYPLDYKRWIYLPSINTFERINFIYGFTFLLLEIYETERRFPPIIPLNELVYYNRSVGVFLCFFFSFAVVRPKLNACVSSLWALTLYPGFSLSVSNGSVFLLGRFGNTTTVICNVIWQWSEPVPVELYPLGHPSETYILRLLVSLWTFCLSWLIWTTFWRN